MTDRQDATTVGTRLKELGLAEDPFGSAAAAGRWWTFEVWGVTLYCYNFTWRRRALAYHDLHHVVTGYPCNMKGEMQVATWEFAAGPCPSRFGQLFCLPLVAMGAAAMPRKTFTAYRNGRRSKSLFACDVNASITSKPVFEIRRKVQVDGKATSLAADLAGYAMLVGTSALTYVLPTTAVLLLAQHFLR